MAKDLLLEIGTEEIPAGFMPAALENLKSLAGYILNRNLVQFDEGRVTTMGTPRRLVLHISGVAEQQEDKQNKIMGPPLKVAEDGHGHYTPAALGFAKSQGIAADDLQIFPDPKGERLGVIKIVRGRAVKEILPEILPEIIRGLSFPKSMRWGTGAFCFVRPIHWILALFGADKIEFEVAGIRSGNQSYGHRFLSPEPFRVRYLTSLEEELERRFVIVNPDTRKQLIEQQIQQVISRSNRDYKVLEDKELLETVNYLVEYPMALFGYFDPEYLELPREVLINAMREHQRYFCVEYKNGDLCPAFIAISNMPDNHNGLIRQGNERVLKARLADAQFFYQEDLKKPLLERLEGLKGMTYQQDLGTYYDKARRIEELAEYIAQKLNLNTEVEIVKRAARLCKCDLLTEMVGEFPKLQGVMGREYARRSGEKEEVAQAIAEHYLPRFAGDILPQTPAGAILSIADKLDTIAGCFGIGLIPSGSQDPYALRRQALGTLQILLDRGVHLRLDKLVRYALGILRIRIERSPERVEKEILELFRQRLSYWFEAQGYRTELCNAILGAGFMDVVEAKLRLGALLELSRMPDFDSLVVAFKRVSRIVPDSLPPGEIDTERLVEPAERELYQQFVKVKQRVIAQKDAHQYLAALQELAALRPFVDRFFDEVFVMVEDEVQRNNRLLLLAQITEAFSGLADLSRLPG